MEQYNETITDRYGNALPGIAVLIRTDAGIPATLYREDGGPLISNPVVSDSNGRISFAAANGNYNGVTQSPAIVPAVEIPEFSLFDKNEYVFAQPLGAGHFVQSGAKIQRISDRLLVAGATANDGRFPNDAKDWLSTFQTAAGLSNGSIVSATSAVLNGPNEQSAQTFVAGAQSLGFKSAATSCIGNSAYAVNNNLLYATKAWAFYGEAHKVNATSSSVYAMELDTRTLVETIDPNPYQQGDVIGLQIASGCELAAGPQFDASAAVQIEPNPKKFKVGINIGALALTAAGIAMALARGHKLRWYRSTSQVTAEIVSTSTTESLRLDFATDGLQFKKLDDSLLAYMDTTGRFTVGPLSTTPRTISAIKATPNTEPLGGAANPQLFIKNVNGAALGEKAEINFAISGQDYSCAAVSVQYSQFNASGDVGADIVFATRHSTADGGLKERARIDSRGRWQLLNVPAAPTANLAGGGILYVEGGALKFRGSAGTVTTIAPA